MLSSGSDTGFYLVVFGALAMACAGVVYAQNRGTSSDTTTDDFKKFQRSFLAVYFLASLSDWLQGPYVYALYATYGFSQEDIGILFIAGFGASLMLGTVVAGLGDKFGRALNCKLFAVFYMASCITKHFNNFHVLMLGRILGGIATSILSSSFESWMVSAHNKAVYPKEWLNQTFTLMTFSSGVAAILAGLLASLANQVAGPVAPFDLASLVLVGVLALVTFTWEENTGTASVGATSFSGAISGFKAGLQAIASNQKIAMLAIIQSLYEGAMFIFVFMWTPALEGAAKSALLASDPDADVDAELVPHGLIFASFMACIMLGSRSVAPLLKSLRVEDLATLAFAAATMLLTAPIFVAGSPHVLLLAFCGFEVVCGLYFPLVGIQRSEHVPEEIRSTLMNIFRVGLNIVVMLVLVNIGKFSSTAVFTVCSACMLCATLAQNHLSALTRSGTGKSIATAAAAAREDGESDGESEVEKETPEA